MKLIDGFLDKMKLSSDDDEYDDDDMMEDEEPVSSRKSRKNRSEDIFDEPEEDEDYTPKYRQTQKKAAPKPVSSRPASNKVVSMRRTSSTMEVCVFKPTNIEDGREISDTLLSGKAVVLNLEGLEVSLAQRIIDFTSGSCYSIHGNLQKVTNCIFVVTPESVDISGDFQELISSDFSISGGMSF